MKRQRKSPLKALQRKRPSPKQGKITVLKKRRGPEIIQWKRLSFWSIRELGMKSGKEKERDERQKLLHQRRQAQSPSQNPREVDDDKWSLKSSIFFILFE